MGKNKNIEDERIKILKSKTAKTKNGEVKNAKK